MSMCRMVRYYYFISLANEVDAYLEEGCQKIEENRILRKVDHRFWLGRYGKTDL